LHFFRMKGLTERRCSPSVGTRRDVSWALMVEPSAVSLPYRFWNWPRAPSVMFSVRSLARAWTLPGSKKTRSLSWACRRVYYPSDRVGRPVGRNFSSG